MSEYLEPDYDLALNMLSRIQEENPGEKAQPAFTASPQQLEAERVWKDLDVYHRHVLNEVVYARREIAKLLTDPRRDVEKDCGHPETSDVHRDIYWHLFERDAIAGRVVEVMCKEAWQVTPKVYAGKGSEEQEQFDLDWAQVSVVLRGMKSWHKQEQGSLIWSKLRNADILSGVGHFGIVLLGFDDVGRRHPLTGKRITLKDPMDLVLASCDLDPEVDMGMDTDPELAMDDVDPDLTVPTTGPNTDDGDQWKPASSYLGIEAAKDYAELMEGGDRPRTKLLFIRTFPEYLVTVTKWDGNQSSPRFTQPVEYMITFNDPHVTHGGVGITQTTKHVHWTRVIHLADDDHQASASPTTAPPRLRPVLNNILDGRKLYGGSAEMYWRAAFPGLSFETIPQLGGNVNINFQNLRDMYEKYINGMDRAIYTKAMQVKVLAPGVVDPTPQINVHIQAICIKLGIPMRVFMGSERGELASTQDDKAWNDRLKGRQDTYITPQIIVPFIDRLIMAGVLTAPTEGYTVEWPDLTSKSDDEKATVALKRTQALVAFLSGNGESAMTFQDFLISFMEFTEEEAKAIVETWEKQQAGVDVTVPDEGQVTEGGGAGTSPQSGPAAPEESTDLSEYEDMFSEVT